MKPQGRKGVVLLEVLLAMTLFVISATVIGTAMNSSLQASIDIRAGAKAANLAESVMSELLAGAMPLVEVPATPFPEPDQDWTYEITLQDVIGTLTLKRVIVTVQEAAGRPHSYSLVQLMPDPALESAAPLPEEEFAPMDEMP